MSGIEPLENGRDRVEDFLFGGVAEVDVAIGQGQCGELEMPQCLGGEQMIIAEVSTALPRNWSVFCMSMVWCLRVNGGIGWCRLWIFAVAR